MCDSRLSFTQDGSQTKKTYVVMVGSSCQKSEAHRSAIAYMLTGKAAKSCLPSCVAGTFQASPSWNYMVLCGQPLLELHVTLWNS